MAEYEYRGLTLAQWREAARTRLARQQARVLFYGALYDGEPLGTTLSGESRELFKRLLEESRTNWCELVVNAVAERLALQWFDFGNEATNDKAWAIWQASGMDADSEMAQTDSLVFSLSPVSVWPDEGNPTGAQIHIEHPGETVLLFSPLDRRKPIAAYKSIGTDWRDGDPERRTLEVLVLPDVVATWEGANAIAPTVQDNPVGEVPYRQLTPAPRTVGDPRSELHSAATIQKRINTTIYNRLVATDFGAFRQITATGVKLGQRTITDPTDPEKVLIVPEAPFNVGADRLLASENADAKIAAIPEATLSGYLSAVEADVQHLAAITQTPPHYLLGHIANISGEALKAAESGLVSKVRRRAAHIGEAWEDVMRLALGFVGDPEAANFQAEVVWRDFETRSEGELVDALVKMSTLGVPRQALWTRWGATPPQIKRWTAMADAASAAPAPQPEEAAA